MKTLELQKVSIALDWWCNHGAFANLAHVDDLRSFQRDLNDACSRKVFNEEHMQRVVPLLKHIETQIRSLEENGESYCTQCGDRVAGGKRHKLDAAEGKDASGGGAQPHAAHPSRPCRRYKAFVHSCAWGCHFDKSPPSSASNTPSPNSPLSPARSRVPRVPAPIRLDLIPATKDNKPRRQHQQQKIQSFRLDRRNKKLQERQEAALAAALASDPRSLHLDNHFSGEVMLPITAFDAAADVDAAAAFVTDQLIESLQRRVPSNDANSSLPAASTEFSLASSAAVAAAPAVGPLHPETVPFLQQSHQQQEEEQAEAGRRILMQRQQQLQMQQLSFQQQPQVLQDLDQPHTNARVLQQQRPLRPSHKNEALQSPIVRSSAASTMAHATKRGQLNASSRAFVPRASELVASSTAAVHHNDTYRRRSLYPVREEREDPSSIHLPTSTSPSPPLVQLLAPSSQPFFILPQQQQQQTQSHLSMSSVDQPAFSHFNSASPISGQVPVTHDGFFSTSSTSFNVTPIPNSSMFFPNLAGGGDHHAVYTEMPVLRPFDFSDLPSQQQHQQPHEEAVPYLTLDDQISSEFADLRMEDMQQQPPYQQQQQQSAAASIPAGTSAAARLSFAAGPAGVDVDLESSSSTDESEEQDAAEYFYSSANDSRHPYSSIPLEAANVHGVVAASGGSLGPYAGSTHTNTNLYPAPGQVSKNAESCVIC